MEARKNYFGDVIQIMGLYTFCELRTHFTIVATTIGHTPCYDRAIRFQGCESTFS